MAGPRKVIFLYWGRRGGLTPYVLGVHRAALAEPGIAPLLCVSRQNDDFAAYSSVGNSVIGVDTFRGGAGALGAAWRIPLLRGQLARLVRDRGIELAVTLMPHVWSAFVATAIRGAGARYVSIIHDAAAHPGDRTGLVNDLLLRDARVADRVVTLSESVREHIVARGIVPADRVTTLFLPDFDYDATIAPPPKPGEPFRLLFLGRIMAYKGLGLLVDAVELLRARGLNVALGVYGSGSLEPHAARLRALGATVVNRWLSDADIAEALSTHHAMALSYTEASQSGVAAVASGAGLPAVATPVGGLREQIVDGVNGVLAAAPTAAAFADAIQRLVGDPSLYAAIRACLASGSDHSPARFVQELIAAALG